MTGREGDGLVAARSALFVRNVFAIQTILQVSLAIVAIIGSVIFAVAEEAPIAALTVPITVATFLAVDLWKWWSLPTWGANLLGLVSFLAAGYEFQSGGAESRLLAGGHLLAYLTWSMLPQAKASRQVWWLLGLSVLQVAVSAVLTSQPWFGAALLVYIFASLWTMAVFSLYRAAIGATAVENAPDARITLPEGTAAFTVANGRSGSRLRHGVKAENVGRWLGGRFVWGGLVTTVLAITVGLLFFVFTPRVWIQGVRLFDDSPLAGGTLTGFTDQVKLGDMGLILESGEVVMQIDLYDNRTDERLPAERYAQLLGDAEPAFRGAVMEYYSHGSWTRMQNTGSGPIDDLFGTNADLRLEITLQPIGSTLLFALNQFATAEPESDSDPLWIRYLATELHRGDDIDQQRKFKYAMFLDQSDRSIRSQAGRVRRRKDNRFYRYRAETMAFPAHLVRTQEQAHRLVADVGRNADGSLNRRAMAERIESWLRDSGEFTYSLNLSVTDPTIDPVEDFLFNRKRGHCEYFASAMALMLRSVAIPARVISGFKGVQVDPTENRLEVRQFHAHAWVEAHIDGEWISFDPTTGGRDDSVAENEEANSGALRNVLDRTRSFWSAGMALNRTQQDELVYQPLRDTLNVFLEQFRSFLSDDSQIGRTIKDLLNDPSAWISWRGGVAVSLLLLAVTALAWAIHKLWLLLPRGRGDWRAKQARDRRVAFYERLQRILARSGCVRGQSETPREFARAANTRLREPLFRAGLTETVPRLIDRFYDVRFGEIPLSPQEEHSVIADLDALEAALRNHESTH